MKSKCTLINRYGKPSTKLSDAETSWNDILSSLKNACDRVNVAKKKIKLTVVSVEDASSDADESSRRRPPLPKAKKTKTDTVDDKAMDKKKGRLNSAVEEKEDEKISLALNTQSTSKKRGGGGRPRRNAVSD